jgi:hypothetical protein
MSAKRKENIWLGKISTREVAIDFAKDCGGGLLILAALQAGLAYFIGYSTLIDAAIYAVCGYFIRTKQSRVAAIVAFALALLSLVVTALNKMGYNLGGGSNILLALIIAWACARAAEATFKLHGRFSMPPPENI